MFWFATNLLNTTQYYVGNGLRLEKLFKISRQAFSYHFMRRSDQTHDFLKFACSVEYVYIMLI